MEEKTAMKKLKTHDKYEDDWLTKKEAPYYYKECIWVFRFIGIFSLLNAVLLAAYWRIRVAEAAVPCLELGVIWLIMCWCRSVSHRKSKRNAAELLLIGILTVGYTGYAAHEMRCYWLLLPLAVETGICIWIYARGVWKKKNPPPIRGK